MIGTRSHFAGIGMALQSPNSTEQRKAAAWAKTRSTLGNLITGNDSFRIDDFGNMIRWEDYGDHTSQYGWEIDHTHPSALGGTNHHSNLRALHCKTNRSLGGLLGGALNRR